MSVERVAELVENQHRVICRHLTRPARWRGPVRQEIRHGTMRARRQRVAAAFDYLRHLQGHEVPLDDLLREIHDRAVGGTAFRTIGMRIGHYREFPAPERLQGLVRKALRTASKGGDQPLIAAARLQLQLLMIHPFKDGNGRTARLLCALMLMKAGFRSTLFTAWEQHFRWNPLLYLTTLGRYRRGEIAEMEWVKVALEALARNSMGATCFLNLFPVSSQVEALFQSIDRDVALQSLAGRVPGAISLEEMWHQMERLRLEIAEERGFPRETHHADCEA